MNDRAKRTAPNRYRLTFGCVFHMRWGRVSTIHDITEQRSLGCHPKRDRRCPMTSDFGAEYGLQRRLVAFWLKKGFPVESVEAGYLPIPHDGLMLCVNFLPSSRWFDGDMSSTESMVRWLLIFLISRGLTRTLQGFQSAVNIKRQAQNECEILVKYWCDSSKLRELERRRYSLRSPLSRIPFPDMISGHVAHQTPEPSMSSLGEGMPSFTP